MTTVNGLPVDEWSEKQRLWQIKMAIRMPVEQFDVRRLVGYLLTQHWMHECVIQTSTPEEARDPIDYSVPYPQRIKGTHVYYEYEHPGLKEKTKWCLRYSHGPGTGTFWDIIADDFHSPELALIELSKAYPPPCLGVVPTHGRY